MTYNVIVGGICVPYTDRVILDDEMKRLMDEMPCGIAVCHMTGENHFEVEYVNKHLCKLAQAPREQLMQHLRENPLSNTFPDDREVVKKAYSDAIDSTQVNTSEYRAVLDSGDVVWLSLKIRAIQRDDGSYTTYGIYTDITDSARANELLDAERKKSEQQYKVISHMYKALPYGIIWCGREWRPKIYHCNQKGTQMLGFPSWDKMTQSENVSLMSYIHPDDIDVVSRAIGALTEKGNIVDITFRMLDTKKKIHWVSGTVSSVRALGGQFLVQFIYMDVTKTKDTMEKAYINGEAMKIAAKQNNMLFWTYDIKKRRVIHETGTSEVPGRELVEENIPQSIFESGVVHPDDEHLVREMYDDIFMGKPTATATARWKDKETGKYVWFNTVYTVIFDEKGKPVKAIGSKIDVSEKILMEEKFNRQMSYRNVVEQNLLASFHLNLSADVCSEGRSEYSEIMKIKSGCTVDEFFARIEENISDEMQREEFKNIFNRKSLLERFSDGTETLSSDHRRRVSGNRSIWVSTHINMVKNPVTKDIEALVYTFDVNEQRVLKDLFTSVIFLDYDYILELDGRENTYTMHFSENTQSAMPGKDGGNYEDSCAKCIGEYVLAEDTEKTIAGMKIERIKGELEKNDVYTVGFRMREHDGRVSTKSIQYSYIDRIRELILVTRRDVSNVVKKEQGKNELLRSALLAANQASIAKSEFLSRISHEIRTPMNAVIGMTAIAKRSIDDRELVADCITKIDTSSRFLLALINDILDMSRLESGKVVLVYERFSLKDMVESINTICESQAQAGGIEYICRMQDRDDMYMGDMMKLQQVIINLISNAIKFTPLGGRVTFDISFGEILNGAQAICFTVRDTGCGIKQEFIPHLFEPFMQEHSGSTSAYGGTGLGLAISKSIIDMMGGDIAVESAIGDGSEFTVDVNMALSDDQSRESEEDEQRNISLRGKKILLVEDHPMNAEIAGRILSGAGICVENAENGEKGLEKFCNSDCGYYDGILMDIRMPVMDGLEATKRIRGLDRADAKTVPIIAMTANAFSEDIEKTKAVGMNGHLAKPIDPGRLIETLDKLI